MKRIKLIFSLFFLIYSTFSFGQQLQQKTEMKLDSLGNARITVTQTMNAQQWQIWNLSFGNNPTALKRVIQRSMPTYFFEDYKLEKDDMNRSFTFKVKAIGVCKIDKKGKWILELDDKKPNLTELTDHKFMLVTSPPEFGGMMLQTNIIEFPKEANDIKVDKDAFGAAIFKFEMDGPSSGSSGFNYLQIAGIVLMVVGGGWTTQILLKPKKSIDLDLT